MKKMIQNGLALIFGISLSSTAFAYNNASVAVDNLTNTNLYLYCQLSNNTRFYQNPNQQSHDFNILKNDSDPIDIYIVNQEPFEGPNMVCYNHQNLDDQFSYRFDGDEETVKVSGHFHYDRSYPGSITFESH
ncbi:MAG: hypothetical protein NTV32_04470 [Gammaproteobacteria bacterium]|nr:hypothetical protein [Gammaproteobacteria bacterium]